MEIHLVSHRHCVIVFIVIRVICLLFLFYFILFVRVCVISFLSSCAKISAKRNGQRIQWTGSPIFTTASRYKIYIFFLFFSLSYFHHLFLLLFFFFISFFYKSTISSLPERDAAIHDVESRANSSHHQHPLEPSLSLNTLSLSLSPLVFFLSFAHSHSLSLSHFIIFTRSLDSFVLLSSFFLHTQITL